MRFQKRLGMAENGIFQFHYGSIDAEAFMSRYMPSISISIPLWFD